tara:strand:+ start:712 stop:1071 length:360 start_codon:yes stop_codon:yes gene_type:complete
MAQTTTWSVSNMKRNTSTGGVELVYWSCIVSDNDNPDCVASDGGKLRCNPDPSSGDFIAYASLKESDVLGWVHNSLIQKKEDDSNETATESKARIEKVCQDKVTAKVADKVASSTGMPW